MTRRLVGVGAVGVIVLVWWIATSGLGSEERWISPVILPSPMEVIKSFPVLLIVIGLVKIAQRSAPDTGHIQPPPYYPPGMPVPPAPPPVSSNRSDSEVNRG